MTAFSWLSKSRHPCLPPEAKEEEEKLRIILFPHFPFFVSLYSSNYRGKALLFSKDKDRGAEISYKVTTLLKK